MLKYLMPLPKPDMVEVTATAVMIAVIKTWVFVLSTTPIRELSAELICIAPNPRDVATPRSVPTVQKASVTCPIGPRIRSPRRG